MYSFDMFDTLVTRNLARPDDLFGLLALNSPQLKQLLQRRLVETELGRQGDVSLEQIYAHLFNGDMEKASRWMQKEVELERKMLCARPSILAYLNGIRAAKLEWAVVSDTPHSTETLTQFLSACIGGETPPSTLILSSSDELTSKKEGKLFEILINRTKRPPSNILHTGDNCHSDITMGNFHQIQTQYMPSPMDNYLHHKQHSKVFRELSNDLSPAESVCIGIMKNRWFDQGLPSPYNGDLTQFGYMAYGPIVFAISIWLLDVAKSQNKKRLFCVSRDGYIFDQIINKISKSFGSNINSHYLYASRSVSKLVKVENIKDLKYLLSSRRGNQADQIKAVFGCQIDGVRNDKADFGHLMKHVEDLKLSYLEYLRHSKLEPDDILFDIGYQGTTQSAIQKIMNIPIFGAYIQTFPEISSEVENYCEYTTSYVVPNTYGKLFEDFQKFRHMHETIFSAPHGSLIGYNGHDRMPVFGANNWSVELQEIHDGICLFADDFLSAWPHGIGDIRLRPKMAFAHVHQHLRNPSSDADILMLQRLTFEDSFSLSTPRPFISSGDGRFQQPQKYGLWREGELSLMGVATHSRVYRFIKKLFGGLVIQLFSILIPNPAKKRKLLRDPFLFFADTKQIGLRYLRHLFD